MRMLKILFRNIATFTAEPDPGDLGNGKLKRNKREAPSSDKKKEKGVSAYDDDRTIVCESHPRYQIL